jgi:hypothetical protein
MPTMPLSMLHGMAWLHFGLFWFVSLQNPKENLLCHETKTAG